MHSRTFSTIICLLWLATMTWLVSQKVWPSLRIGQPPNYRTVLESQKNDPVVGWRLLFRSRELGWALSTTDRQESGVTEIRSHVHINDLPVIELTSILSKAFSHLMATTMPKISLDTQNSFMIDPLGKLARFDSVIHTNVMTDAIRIQGVAEGPKMQVSIEAKEFSEKKEVYIPQNALMGDSLSPQTHLPNLREGQTWTVPSFSPFRSSSNPIEILTAKVEKRVPFTWNDESLDVWEVVYRADPGLNFGGTPSIRGKLWVSEDGRVLQQETAIFDSTMTFTRMSDEDAEALEKQDVDNYFPVRNKP
jgi:hypothetical protein